MKSLVVDDGFTNRRVLSTILSEYGQCDQAENGMRAIELFNETFAYEIPPYDLICLDIMMPYKNGQAVLMEFRKTEKLYRAMGRKAVTVIMVTSLNSQENVKLAIEKNCKGYILKPVIKEKMVALLHQLKLID